MERLEVGQVYVATAALEGQRSRLAVVIGRTGRTLQLAFVNELALAQAHVFEDSREYALADTQIGRYTISSAAEASAAEAATIQEILKLERKEGGFNADNSK